MYNHDNDHGKVTSLTHSAIHSCNAKVDLICESCTSILCRYLQVMYTVDIFRYTHVPLHLHV